MVQDFANFMEAIPWPVFFITAALAAAPLALLHEIGHAVAAVSRLPGRVLVHVGGDKPTTTFDVGRISFRLHPVVRPWRLNAVCLYPLPQSRGDAVLISLGGPATSLVVGLAAVAAARATDSSSTVHWVIASVAFEALLGGLVCLTPMTLTDSRGLKLRSDGAQVVAALRGRPTFHAPERQWFQSTTGTPLGPDVTRVTVRDEGEPAATRADGNWTLRPPRNTARQHRPQPPDSSPAPRPRV